MHQTVVFGVSRDDSNGLVLPCPKQDQVNREFPKLPSDLTSQENILVFDLILVINGAEGDYVRFAEQFDPLLLDDRLRGPQFKFAPSMEPKFMSLVKNIAEIGGNVYVVQSFAQHYSGLQFGKVNQALARAFETLLLLFTEHVSKIEANTSSLYSLWVYLQPFANHLINAKRLVLYLIEKTRLARQHNALDANNDDKEALIELRGGAVLRCIAEVLRHELGDHEASNLYEELINAASEPYLKFITKWLEDGDLDDIFEEFAVQKTSAIQLDRENVEDYWDKHYSIKTTSLPLQLSDRKIYKKLLVSGQYLNVIRATGDSVSLNGLGLDKCKSVEDPKVLEAISKAYSFSNRLLLNHLHTRQGINLKSIIQSLHDVFLTDEVTDTLKPMLNELKKFRKDISLMKIQYAFTLFKDEDKSWAPYVTLKLCSESLNEKLLSVISPNNDDNVLGTPISTSSSTSTGKLGQLTGIETLTLDYKIPFPLSVVITQRAITRYQFLFRFIFELNATRSMLNDNWLDQVKDPRWRIAEQTNEWVRRTNLLRESQQHFVDDLVYCCAIDGINDEYQMFKNKIDTCEEVGALAELHMQFLDRCLVRCLLSSPRIVKIISRILSVNRQFAKFVDANAEVVEFACGLSEIEMKNDEGEVMQPDQVLSWYIETLEQYEKAFYRNLQRLCDVLEKELPHNYGASFPSVYLLQRAEPLIKRYLTVVQAE